MTAPALETALQALSDAHGHAEVLRAVRHSARVVRALRGQDRQAQTLGQIVMEAVELSHQLRAGGMSETDRDAALERVLRDSWPKPHHRTEPWHYRCEECRDYGLRIQDCPGDATCGRVKPHRPHDFGIPCWCAEGKRYSLKPERGPDDATDRAAKQPAKMSRWGR